MGGVKRLGVLGGTFNPPHLGHLILGEMAREQLGLAVFVSCVADHPLFLSQLVVEEEGVVPLEGGRLV